jgi:hypothetical protein
MRTRILIALLALSVITLVSCTKKTPETTTDMQSTTTTTHVIKVSRIDLGREMTADRRVITTGDASFTPGDTVFASVILSGPAEPTQVTARWTSADGQLVAESTETVTAGQLETAAMFHMVKPAGLPPGTYRVDILANGQVLNTKEFTVTAPSP